MSASERALRGCDCSHLRVAIKKKMLPMLKLCVGVRAEIGNGAARLRRRLRCLCSLCCCHCLLLLLLLLCAPSYLKKIMTKLMLLCFWQHINIIMRSILDEHDEARLNQAHAPSSLCPLSLSLPFLSLSLSLPWAADALYTVSDRGRRGGGAKSAPFSD